MFNSKIFFLLSVFVLLAGCETMPFQDQDRVGVQTTCDSPERKSVDFCKFGVEIIKEPGGNPPFALGVIPKAVVRDNCEQQNISMGTSVDCKNIFYPYDQPYPIQVRDEDLGKLKAGRFYILHGTPSNQRTVETNYLDIDHDFNEAELEEYLAELRKQGPSTMHSMQMQ